MNDSAEKQSRKVDPRIVAAHISGRYLLAAVTIAGIFGLLLCHCITGGFGLKSEGTELEEPDPATEPIQDEYDESVDLKFVEYISLENLESRDPELAKFIEGRFVGMIGLPWVEHRFQNSDLHFRFTLVPNLRGETGLKIHVTTIGELPAQTIILSEGHEWELPDGYSLVLSKVVVFFEQLQASARLYK